MRIRTQFVVSLVLFVAALIAIAATLWVTARDLARIEGQEVLASAIAENAAELSYASDHYLVYRDAERLREWRSRWQTTWRTAEALSPSDETQRTLTAAVRSDLQRQRVVFQEVTQALTTARPTPLSPEALVGVSWSRMTIQNESLIFDAQRLMRVTGSQRAIVERRGFLITAILLAGFAVYLLVYLALQRRWLGSLAKLREGTEIVGSGDLEFAIPVSGKDEVGELAAAFNRMTGHLKNVMASKEQLENEIARTEALLHTATSLVSGVRLSDVLDSVCASVLTSTPHSRATVSLWDEDGAVLTVAASRGDPPVPIGVAAGLDEISEDASRSISSRAPVLIDYDALEPGSRGVGDTVTSHLAYDVPLVYRDKLVGMLAVDDPDARRDFDEGEKVLLEGIAAQAAVAIENARLYETEHRIAETLQDTLVVLPRRVPGIEFAREYHSATLESGRVGGDFVDVFEVSDDLVGIVLGDVSGKGVEAAVTTSLIRTTLRVHAIDGAGPGAVGRKANRMVRRFTDVEVYATLWFGLLVPTTGRLRYVSAGHPPALILPPKGDVRLLEHEGPLLGAYEESAFAESETRIAAGERLILYSDGVTEARAPDGTFLDDSGLIASVTRHRRDTTKPLCRAIMDDVVAFSEGVLRDDAALLIVEPVYAQNPPRA